MNVAEWTDARGIPLPTGGDGVQEFALLSGDTRLSHLQLKPPEGMGVDAVHVDGHEKLNLVRNAAGRFAFPAEGASAGRTGFGNAAGVLSAVCVSGGKEVDRVPLRVLPANFTPEEYAQMLRDIARVAVASLSLVTVRSSAQRLHQREAGEAIGILGTPSEPLVDALREFMRKAEAAIWTIASRPLRMMARQKGMTPIHKAARNAAGVRRVATRLDRRHVMSESLEEHLDATENRHVRWMLEQFVLPLVSALRAAEPELPPMDEDHEHQVREHLLPGTHGSGAAHDVALPEPNARREAFRVWLEGRNAELDDMAAELTRWLAVEPLKASRSVSVAPSPTSRMSGTPGYREILEAFRELAGNDIERWLRGLALSDAVIRHEVHATWRCYEYWCFSQLIEAFITVAGFNRRGKQAFADIIEISNGELHIRPESSVTLFRDAQDGGSLVVTIRYQAPAASIRNHKGERLDPGRETQLVPDFVVALKYASEGAVPLYFVFDAKYRDYGRQGADTMFQDLVTTALLKYRDGISRPDREIHGSYILHSDPTPPDASRDGGDVPVDFWGGMNSERWLRAHARSRGWMPRGDEAILDERPGHTCGLIRLRPDEDRLVQLGRLVDMLLLYHMARSSYAPHPPSCSRCGSDIEPFKKESLDPRRRSRPPTLYKCSNAACSHAWFHNECTHCGTSFVKMGRRSFHERSRNRGWKHGGMYICPNCYDDRKPDAPGVSGPPRPSWTPDEWDSIPPPEASDYPPWPDARPHTPPPKVDGDRRPPAAARSNASANTDRPPGSGRDIPFGQDGPRPEIETPTERAGSTAPVANDTESEERPRLRRNLFGD